IGSCRLAECCVWRRFWDGPRTARIAADIIVAVMWHFQAEICAGHQHLPWRIRGRGEDLAMMSFREKRQPPSARAGSAAEATALRRRWGREMTGERPRSRRVRRY